MNTLKENEYVELGERLRALRKENGYSAQQVAELTNLSTTTVYRHEKEATDDVMFFTLKRYAEIYGVDFNYLITGNANLTTQDTLINAIIKDLHYLTESDKKVILYMIRNFKLANDQRR